MSVSRQPLSTNYANPLFKVSLNNSQTSLILDSDTGQSSILLNTNNQPGIYIDKYQNVGINITTPSSQLDINSSNGSCLRLIYNNTSNYSTINISNSGNMSLFSSGGEITIPTNINLNIKSHDNALKGLQLAGVLLTASATQLNCNDVIAGSALANKTLILDNNGAISGITSISSTNIYGTLQSESQPNIKNIGTLSNLIVTGTIIGTLQTASQPNITSIGILNNLTISDKIILGTTTINELQLQYITEVTIGLATARKALIIDSDKSITGINVLSTNNIIGLLITSNQPNITNVGILNNLSISGTLLLNSTAITASATQINYNNVTPGSAIANKTMVLDANASISGINSITIGGNTLNSTLVGYLTGITPGTALANKALILDSTNNITGINSIIIGGNALNSTLVGYLTGITPGSALASKAIILDSNSNITGINTITIGENALNSTLVGYLTGITPGTALASKAVILDSTSNITGINSITIGGNALNSILVGYLTGITPGAALASKAVILDSTSNITGINTITIGGNALNSTLVGYLTGITPGTALASKALILNANTSLFGINVLSLTTLTLGANNFTTTQAGYLTGITPGTALASKALILDNSSNLTGVNSLFLINNTKAATVTSISTSQNDTGIPVSNLAFFINNSNLGANGSWIGNTTDTSIYVFTNNLLSSAPAASAACISINKSNVNIINHNGNTGLQLSGVLITATSAQLNYNNVSPGVALANKTLVLDSNSSVSGINILSLSTLALGNSNFTNIQSEYLTGITPGTALASKAVILDSTSNITGINSITIGGNTLNSTLVGYLTGITPGTALASKALILNASTSISGINALSLTTLTLGTNNFTTIQAGYLIGITPGTALASKALILDSTSNIAGINTLSLTTLTLGASSFTNIQASYLTGITPGTALASKTLILDSTSNIAGINTLSLTTLTLGASSFTNIQASYLTGITPGTALASKALILDSTSNIAGINSITIGGNTLNSALVGYLTGITPGTALASKALILDSTSNIAGINSITIGGNTLNSTLVGYLTGITPGTALASKALILDSTSNIAGINSITIGGNTLNSTLIGYLTGITPGAALASKALILDATSNIAGINTLSLTTLTLGANSFTTTQAGYLIGITPGTALASKALILDSTSNIAGINSITIGGNTLNSALVGYLTGVTPGTALASKALILDSSRNIIAINSLTSSIFNASAVGIGFKHSDGIINFSTFVNNTSDTSAIVGTTSNHGLKLQTNNSTKLIITAAGLVGIATTPNYALDVLGSIKSSSTLLLGTSTDTTKIISALDSNIANNTSRVIALGKSTASNNQAEISYFHSSDNSTNNGLTLGFSSSEKIRLIASGNLGINTTTPTSLVTISYSSSVGSSEASINGLMIASGSNTACLYMGADATNNVTYIQSSKVGTTLPLVINNRGSFVGIGTDTPDRTLDVNGVIKSRLLFYNNINSTSKASYSGSWPTSNYWGFGADPVANTIRASINDSLGSYLGTANFKAFKLLLGDSIDDKRFLSALKNDLALDDATFFTLGKSESTGLQAEFAYKYKGNTDGELIFQFFGITNVLVINTAQQIFRSTNSSNFNTTSDNRLKEEIVDANVSICYNNVKKLRLVRYRWKDIVYPPTETLIDRRRLGWIAQEVEEVLPKSVITTSCYGIEDCKTIDIDQINTMLYGCVKKIIEDKELLELQNQQLTNKVVNLEERIKILEYAVFKQS